MPALDTSAKAAVERSFARADFIFLDLAGADGPLRVTTFGQDVTFSGTGDADLDGHTFVAFGGSLLTVSDVSNSESGSDTRVITLSGIVGIDDALLADIGDKSLWQGRICRTWFKLYDENGATEQGAIVADYTGYMSKVPITAAPGDQSISLSAENYLAFFSQASNRSYLNQKDYDSADTSAAATIACSNGLRRDTGAGLGIGGGATPQSTAGASSYINSYAPYGGALDESGVMGAAVSFR